jgi:transcription elongation factor S-II
MMAVALRENARALIHEHLGTSHGVSDAEAGELEKGIFNWTIDFATEKGVVRNWSNAVFKRLYLDKFRSVLANIDATSYVGNADLRARMRSGEFQPQHIAFMERQQVCPAVWRDLVEDKIKRDAHIGENTVTAMTDQFKCGRCKKRECVYYEVQTRSGDEPMDLRITCLNCGNRWRA